MSPPQSVRVEPGESGNWLAGRRAAALVQAAVVLLLPFARAGGESALRFDVPSLTLHAFGRTVGIDEFPVVLLGVVLALAAAAGGTVILGRVWCGWSCPQTTLPLLAAWAAGAFPRRARRTAASVALVLLSAAVSFALIGYFVPPAEAARGIARSPVLAGFFLSIFALHILMLAVLGTRFCRTVCPYAMLQNVLFDRDTLVVAYDPARDSDCLRDESCVRVCPVGIDIRKGLQRECIACAECIDACARVTAARGITSLVGYRGRPFRGKAAAWALALIAASAALAAAAGGRPAVEFAVQWVGPTAEPELGRYGFAIRNNTGRPLDLLLRTEGDAAPRGAKRILVGARSRVTGEIFARAAGPPSARGASFVLSGPGIRIRKRATSP